MGSRASGTSGPAPCITLTFLGACAPAAPIAEGSTPLVDMAAWVDLGLPDPLEAHRPAGAACATGSWGPESGSLEVDTGACGFLSVRQPLRAWLEAGDPVELVLWHDWLTAEAPATGHLALFAGEALLFEHLVDIPADPEAYTFTFDSPLSAAPGASVTLHLHNHGANTWNLLRLERVEP